MPRQQHFLLTSENPEEAAVQSVGQNTAFDSLLHSEFGSPGHCGEQNEQPCAHTLGHICIPRALRAGPPLLHSAGREGRSEQHPAFFTSFHAVTPCLSCSQQHLPGNPFPAAPRWSFKSFERLSLKFLHRNHCLMFSGTQEGGGKPACL